MNKNGDHHDDDDDLDLIERILESAEGDTRAFEALVLRHSKGVVANCRFITRSAVDAEDLAQDVFVKAYFAIRRFERRSKFRTWLQRIKVNHCLNYVKKRESRSFVDLDSADRETPAALRADPQAWRRIQLDDERRQVDTALCGLSDTLRIPLVLRDMDGMSYQEIADLLGIGLSAVKMRIKRARQEFRQRFGHPERGGTAEV